MCEVSGCAILLLTVLMRSMANILARLMGLRGSDLNGFGILNMSAFREWYKSDRQPKQQINRCS